MTDILLVIVLSVGISFGIIFIASIVLQRFIALKSLPDRRAAYTAGTAYLLAVGVIMFGGMVGYEWTGPLVAAPGALAEYLMLRSGFRKRWVENDEALLDVQLENDDWRIGVAAVGAAAIAAFVRYYSVHR